MESGIFVRDFGTRLEEINLTNSGITMGYTFFINSLSHVTLFYEPLFLFPEAINFSNICKLMYSPV